MARLGLRGNLDISDSQKIAERAQTIEQPEAPVRQDIMAEYDLIR
jgi:hypothetical protein